MKNLILILSLLFSANVYALTITVAEGVPVKHRLGPFVGVSLEKNSDSGRVAVNLEFRDTYHDGDESWHGSVNSIRKVIPGLTYNSDTNKATYTTEAGEIVYCAKKTSGNQLKLKDGCSIEIIEREAVVDDGWDIDEIDVVDVYLHIHI